MTAAQWYAADCPPWRHEGAWGDCDRCLVSNCGVVVPLEGGVCPLCGMDWRTDAQKPARVVSKRDALIEVVAAIGGKATLTPAELRRYRAALASAPTGRAS